MAAANRGVIPKFTLVFNPNAGTPIPKITLVFNPNAETLDDVIHISMQYVSFSGCPVDLSLSKLKFREFLELCSQPKTDEEKDSVVSDFQDKLKCISDNDICEFDVLCLYALYYVYENSCASLCAVSRALYAWYKLDDLVSHGCENRNSILFPGNWDDCEFLSHLREFSDLNTNSQGLKVLVFALFESFMSANLGLARFLLKFGLIDFDCSDNSIQLLSMVFKKLKKNNLVTIYTDVDRLGARIQLRSKFSFRRSILTFFNVVLVAQYIMFEYSATELGEAVAEELKCKTILKLKCLALLISATTEPKITSTDIEYFIATIFDPFRYEEKISMRYVKETFQKMSSELNAIYCPRSLKEITRCKIRSCLQGPQMLPEQVMKLTIPVPLKDFLLFRSKRIWDLLVQSHLHVSNLLQIYKNSINMFI